MTPVCSSSFFPVPKEPKLRAPLKRSVSKSPRSPPGSKIFDLGGVGVGEDSTSLQEEAPVPLPESPGRRSQLQSSSRRKPECARLSSSPASGRGMEAVARLSHSVVQSERQQRLRCCGCSYCWQKAEKGEGDSQGAGCKGLGQLL